MDDFELIIDNFAGGGGASTGIERALGRAIDIAINHDPDAIRMHHVNHPLTKHLCESVWDVNPMIECAGRPVGLAWFSPDCKHFSKAKGDKPVEKSIRGLAWVVLRWMGTVKPRLIVLENVEEFITWGPLVRRPDGKLYPCPRRKGRTFHAFINAMRKYGYAVEHRILRASDYGDPTSRERLFIIARCDGQQIVWPEPTHGDPASDAVKTGDLKPWRTAAECIQWEIPCPSIFLRKPQARKLGIRRPLAKNTMRRIAKGVMKYVVNAADPFIVTYYGMKDDEFRGQSIREPLRTQTTENRHGIVVPHFIPLTHQGADRSYDIRKPSPTITAAHRGELALVASTIVKNNFGSKPCHGVSEPLHTITTQSNKHALVAAFLAKHYGGHETPGWPIKKPLSTVTARDHHAVVTSHLIKLKGTNTGQDARMPLQTLTASGQHFGQVQAFLIKYFGTDQNPHLREPLHTITARDRFGLVMVEGEPYQIADIGMRMFRPRELFRCQGFEDSYIIDKDANGKRFTIEQQVRMVGNSVCPGLACALVSANYVPVEVAA